MKIVPRYIQSLQETIDYKIGLNANDNFDLIDSSNNKDIWFHLSDTSSGHVIANIPLNSKYNKKQFRQIIKQGALVCKENSKFKSHNNIEIVYTSIDNVVKTNVIGQVKLLNFKLINI